MMLVARRLYQVLSCCDHGHATNPIIISSPPILDQSVDVSLTV